MRLKRVLNDRNILSVIVLLVTSLTLLSLTLINRKYLDILVKAAVITIPSSDVAYHGPTLLRNYFDYAPSIMFDEQEGKYKMWWCGKDPSRIPKIIDVIYYSESANGHNWSLAQKVYESPGSPNGIYTCDPTVVKINNTPYNYYMYYTSEGGLAGAGTDNQVFLALSEDGTHWSPAYESKPVIPNTNPNSSYGIGQSSVMFLNNRFIQFYTDTTKGYTGVFVAESTNGGTVFTPLNNGKPVVYNIQSVDVKYVPSRNQYIMVAEQTGANPWSFHYYILDNNFKIVNQGYLPSGTISQPCNHNPGLLGDRLGNILDSDNVVTYFGSGIYDDPPQFPSTPCWNPPSWDIHRLSINPRSLYATPTPTNTTTPTKKPTATPTKRPTNTPVVTSTPVPVAGDATGEGNVDINDYKVWVNNYNSSTTRGHNNADFNNDNQVDGKDYVIWLTNYGN
jgi:hypothetical protein